MYSSYFILLRIISITIWHMEYIELMIMAFDVDILINIDNFYFHCHGQFSLKKFSKTHPRTHTRLENSQIEVGQVP